MKDLNLEPILHVEYGSRAHGTNIDDQADHDELMIVIEPPEQVFSLDRKGRQTRMYRDQPEGTQSQPGDQDLTVYSLRTFLQLAASGNPTIMSTFWCPVIDMIPEYAQDLKDNTYWFIGKHMIPKYRGYMQGQVLRLLGLKGSGHGKRGGGRREELIEAHGYDTKYAAHATRLGFQCMELVLTGKLTMPIRHPEVEILRAIRRGEVSFNEWWEKTLELDSLMEKLLTIDSIPEKSNEAAIVALSIDMHQRWWTRSKALKTEHSPQ